MVWLLDRVTSFADPVNLYMYVRANPVNMVDETGRAGDVSTVAAGGLALARWGAVATGALAADDVTGIGVFDDPLMLLTGAVAVVGLVTYGAASIFKDSPPGAPANPVLMTPPGVMALPLAPPPAEAWGYTAANPAQGLRQRCHRPSR
jgi:hypothetical protein